MTVCIEAALAVDAADVIGEGPAWDEVRGRLIWSDNEGGIVHEARADGEGWTESRRWTLDRPLAGALPRRGGGLVVAGGTEIMLLGEESGTLEPFCTIPCDPGQVRLNEVKCDPQGRLWAGTLSADFSAGMAALYCVEGDGRVRTMLEGITVSNGLDWSPDGATFYYIDSLTMKIDAFDFDGTTGRLSNRRTLVHVPFGAGGPDGMTVDEDGCLWVALVGSGQVQRYAPDGTPLERVAISTPAVTSCAFGGADGGTLFITCLGRLMPDVVLTLGISEDVRQTRGPHPGGLFACRPGIRGRGATPFAG